MNYKLGDIKLGGGDAKREVHLLKDFDEYYYDYNEISKKIMEPINFLVLGKKGTGKTLLAEYLKRNSEKIENSKWFLKLESYKKISLTQLEALKIGVIPSEEYVPIWKWIILIEFAKLCMNNESIYNKKEYFKLEKFLKDYGFLDDLKAKTSSNMETGTSFFIGMKFASLTKSIKENETKVSYLNLIEPLENILISLTQNMDDKYTILFDELDDQFDGSSCYKNSIVCLLKVVDELNFKFMDYNSQMKVIVFLRKDIIRMLNYSDLNKIIEGSSITLEWGTKQTIDSPLLKLLTKKIRKSIPLLADKSDKEIFNRIFNKKQMYISSDKRVKIPEYILSRTLLRPRDLINFLSKIISKYSHNDEITKDMVMDVEKSYSSYLEGEIRGELVGHLNSEEMNEFFTALKHFGKTEFGFDEIFSYVGERRSTYPNIFEKNILEKTARAFYHAGAIGSKRINHEVGQTYFSWSYKENDDNVNLEDKLCIHNGLQKSLGLR